MASVWLYQRPPPPETKPYCRQSSQLRRSPSPILTLLGEGVGERHLELLARVLLLEDRANLLMREGLHPGRVVEQLGDHLARSPIPLQLDDDELPERVHREDVDV
jgi:hypothetical protein